MPSNQSILRHVAALGAVVMVQVVRPSQSHAQQTMQLTGTLVEGQICAAIVGDGNSKSDTAAINGNSVLILQMNSDTTGSAEATCSSSNADGKRVFSVD